MWKFNNFLNNFTWKANLGFHLCLKANQPVGISPPRRPGTCFQVCQEIFKSYILDFTLPLKMHWAKIFASKETCLFPSLYIFTRCCSWCLQLNFCNNFSQDYFIFLNMLTHSINAQSRSCSKFDIIRQRKGIWVNATF